MEEIKEGFCCKKFSFLHVWWIKSLVGFVILLVIFCAGVAFGEHHGGFRGEGRFRMQGNRIQNNSLMRGYNNRGQMRFQKSFTSQTQIPPEAVYGQDNGSTIPQPTTDTATPQNPTTKPTSPVTQ